jgi:hypothetical protein
VFFRNLVGRHERIITRLRAHAASPCPYQPRSAPTAADCPKKPRRLILLVIGCLRLFGAPGLQAGRCGRT